MCSLDFSLIIDNLVFTSPLAVQTMTNFEPLHKLQAHDEYILKCLLSPELCEPNRSGSALVLLKFYLVFNGLVL